MKMILIRGLPGSGKSTLAQVLQPVYNANHYEADMYFMKDGTYRFDGSQLGNAHRWCQDQTELSLRNQTSVIVSNTFTTVKELRPYFEIAQKYGIIPTCYQTCNNWGNIHGVPDEKLVAMRNRFQHDISDLLKEFSK